MTYRYGFVPADGLRHGDVETDVPVTEAEFLADWEAACEAAVAEYAAVGNDLLSSSYPPEIRGDQAAPQDRQVPPARPACP